MIRYGFAKVVICPNCKKEASFDFVIFVFEEASAEFIYTEMASGEGIGKKICPLCNTQVYLPSQFGYYSGKYGATILILEQDCHVDEMESFINSCFQSFFDLDQGQLKLIIDRKPFVFVNGWNGLRNFFSILRGEDFNFSRQKNPSPFFNEVTAFPPVYGYSYGQIFFHFPADFFLHGIIESALKISICYKHHRLFSDAINFVKTVSQLLQHKSPEILKELGLLYMLVKNNQEAKHYLALSKEYNFRWLAPTFSTLDATPSKREDGQTQDSSLPHAVPILTRQKFTDTAHTVLKAFPTVADDGICDFPFLEATCREKEVPSNSVMLDLYSSLLGELYYLFYHHPINNKIHEAAFMMKDEFQNMLAQNEDRIEVSFWCQFAQKAFRLPYGWPLPTSINEIDMVFFSRIAGERMAQLQYERHDIQSKNGGKQDINSYICHNLELAINHQFRSLLALVPTNQTEKAENEMLGGFYSFTKKDLKDI